MLNKLSLWMIFVLLLAACQPKPADTPGSSALRLEATVSALETRVAELQNALAATADATSTALPALAVSASPEPTMASPEPTAAQVTPYLGPIKISALAYTPAGEALYLARTTDLQWYQDGIERSLHTWSEAIPDLLAEFAADRSALAARLNNGDILVIGLPQGEVVHTLKLGVDFEEYPTSLALSPDGAQLALASGENSVQVWDVGAGQLSASLTQPGTGVAHQKLVFSSDGSSLLGGFMNAVTRWDIASGESTVFEPGCRGDTIFDLAYSPDGKQLAIACGPIDNPVGFFILWDMINNQPIFQREEILQVQHIAFSPSGRWLATGGPDGNIMFWDVTGNREPATIQGQGTPVYDLVFSPDGSQLVYATEGGLVYLSLDEIALP